jgi:hypothetical protein
MLFWEFFSFFFYGRGGGEVVAADTGITGFGTTRTSLNRFNGFAK